MATCLIFTDGQWKTSLPPFFLVKPAFGFATFVTVPLLSVRKCLRMGGRDSCSEDFYYSPKDFSSLFENAFFLIDHHLLNAQTDFSEKN